MNRLNWGIFICAFSLLTSSIISCRAISQAGPIVEEPASAPANENIVVDRWATSASVVSTPKLSLTATLESQFVEGEPTIVSNPTKEQPDQNIVKVEMVNTNIFADTESGGGLPSLNVRWSNNGQYMAYTADYGVWIVNVDEWDERKEIYLTHKTPELSECCFASGPNLAWSPNDEMLAFTIFNSAKHTTGVGVYNLISEELNLVSEDVGSVVDWGQKGLIVCNKPVSSCYILDIEHNQQYDIGAFPSPFFSGVHEIVYGLGADTMIKDLDTGEENTVILGNLPLFRSWHVNARPIPSPDGNYIAWVAQDTVSQINIYDRVQQQMLKLPEMADPILWCSVAWSPDSLQLAFIANGTIWIMRLNV